MRLLFSACAALQLAGSVQLSLAPLATECFYESVLPGNKLSGTFEVLSSPQLGIAASAAAAAARMARIAEAVRRGGGMPVAPSGAAVEVTVYDLHGSARFSSARERSGAFTVLAPAEPPEPASFRVCFANAGSEAELVAFALHSGDDLYRGIATKAHVTPLEAEVTELADAISAVEDEQRYAWARERAARDLDERTNSRVAWWSALELLTMVAVGLLQVWATGSFFERKQRY